MSPTPVDGARVLVVDDEITTRAAITRALGLLGYHADSAGSGTQAMARLAQVEYDLMLLDLRMPGMDGVEVMRQVWQQYPELTVIVLTAEASLESAILAVKSGAADYLLKPCSLRDIAAAVQSALERRAEQVRQRRFVRHVTAAIHSLQDLVPVDGPLQAGATTPAGPTPGERYLHAGALTLDRDQRQARLNDCLIDLTSNELALLDYLMRHPATVLSCRALAHGALGYEVSEAEAQDIVRPHISRLRKKLAGQRPGADVIRTIRGRGYLLEPQQP